MIISEQDMRDFFAGRCSKAKMEDITKSLDDSDSFASKFIGSLEQHNEANWDSFFNEELASKILSIYSPCIGFSSDT